MIKKTAFYLTLIYLFNVTISCSSEDTTMDNSDPIIEDPVDEVQSHVPITAFWWNGGWDHYDSESLKHIDEIIIFAIPANPDTGDLLKHSSSTPEETVYIRGRTEPGLTTTMIRTITNDAKKIM